MRVMFHAMHTPSLAALMVRSGFLPALNYMAQGGTCSDLTRDEDFVTMQVIVLLFSLQVLCCKSN